MAVGVVSGYRDDQISDSFVILVCGRQTPWVSLQGQLSSLISASLGSSSPHL